MRKLVLGLAVFLVCVALPLRGQADEVQSTEPASAADGILGGAADPQTGTLVYRIPLRVLSARGGAQPSLNLTYNSRAGVREAGMGWGLDLPSIERQPLSGWPTFNDTAADPARKDRFSFEGKSLVYLCVVGQGRCSTGDPTGNESENWAFPTWANGAQYFRPQVDTLMARFFFFATQQRWRVQLRGGTIMEFGAATTMPGAGGGTAGVDAEGANVSRYKLVRQVDVWGNTVVYVWRGIGVRGLTYLTDIYDTSNVSSPGDIDAYAHHVQLSWQAPPVVTYNALHPDRAAPDLRLSRVVVTSAPWTGGGAREVVRAYWLRYLGVRSDNGETENSPTVGPLWNRSFLASLETCGKSDVNRAGFSGGGFG